MMHSLATGTQQVVDGRPSNCRTHRATSPCGYSFRAARPRPASVSPKVLATVGSHLRKQEINPSLPRDGTTIPLLAKLREIGLTDLTIRRHLRLRPERLPRHPPRQHHRRRARHRGRGGDRHRHRNLRGMRPAGGPRRPSLRIRHRAPSHQDPAVHRPCCRPDRHHRGRQHAELMVAPVSPAV